MNNFKIVWTGLRFKPVTTLTSDSLGEVQSHIGTAKTYLHNGTTRSPLVTETHVATLQNKTISGLTNTITDLTVENLEPTVLVTDLAAGLITDEQIPSALAVKTYVDDEVAKYNEASEITFDNTVSGLAAENVQDAIDEVDADLIAHITDTVDAHDASAISFDNQGDLSAENVQDAIDELVAMDDAQGDVIQTVYDELIDHIQNPIGAHAAEAIAFAPTVTINAIEVQAAIEEVDAKLADYALETDLLAHINDTVGAHAASAISVVPFGSISSTDVQEALEELEAQIAAGGNGDVIGPVSTLDNALVRFDGTTGKLIQTSNITIGDTGVVVGASIDALSSNTITNLGDSAIAANAAIDRSKFATGTAYSVVHNNVSGVMSSSSDVSINPTALALSNTKHIETEAQTDSTTTGSSATLAAFTAGAVRLTNSGLTSIANILQGNNGQQVVLLNRTGADITVADDSQALGTATRRIFTGTGAEIPFKNNAALYLQYDDLTARWQIIGGTGSGTGGGTAELLPSAMAQQTFETAVLADFVQTGLNLVSSPAIKGTKVAQLIHQPATSQSFKQTIAVNPLFRNKQMTFTADIRSTASAGNLTIAFKDETSGLAIGTSQAFTTASQSVSVTTSSGLATLAALSNSVVNTLSVGMSVTGSGIPTSTTIASINSTTGVVTLSAASTASATVTARFSALPAKATFSFTMPVGCTSFSYTVTALQEASLPESYIDDIYIQLSETALTSTSITVPKNNDTERVAYTPVFTGFGTPTAVEVYWNRSGAYLELNGRFLAGTTTAVEARIAFPLAITTAINFPTLTTVGHYALGSANSFSGEILAEPGVGYFTFGQQAIGATVTANKQIASTLIGAGNAVEFFARIPIQGWSANETESKTIPLTSSVLVTQPDSNYQLNGFTWALASTANQILNLTSGTIAKNIGDAVTLNFDSVNGTSIIPKYSGIYSISLSIDDAGSTNTGFGLSKNSNQLTTAYVLISELNKLAVSSWYDVHTLSWTGHLEAQDIVRLHRNDLGAPGGVTLNQLSISYQGSVKQLNPSSDQKIDIPTHSLRFEGASSRGSTDTFIVKFDTLSNIRGDAWDVVNTTANGTVITIKKAGTLSVSTAFLAGDVEAFITLNQTVLTANPTTTEIISGASNAASRLKTLASGNIQVKVGDKIRISSSATATSNYANFLSLSLQENSVQVALSNVLPQFTQGDSAVRLNTATGYGSSSTMIRRFANVPENLGSAITYTDSATLGASFAINEDGVYSMSLTDNANAGSVIGISKNTTTPSIVVSSIAVSERLASANIAANTGTTISISPYLLRGDVIRVHNNGAPANDPPTTQFTISKVGKPNITSVDVTPFVNIQSQDTETVSGVGAGFGSTNTGVFYYTQSTNTNKGILQVDSTAANGTIIRALKKCTLVVSFTGLASNGTGANSFISKNVSGTITPQAPIESYGMTGSTGNRTAMTASISMEKGDFVVAVRQNTNITINDTASYFTASATAISDTVATPIQQISSDTIPFVFKSTAIVDADPVGTFNTYTYAAGGNVATISASAPTQTISSMNTNGVMVTGRAYNATSTTATPTRVDIMIGKGLKGKEVLAYRSLLKADKVSFDPTIVSSTVAVGTDVTYSEVTGILSLNAGTNILTSNTSRGIVKDPETASTYGSAYFVFNASTAPSIAALPTLQPRIAMIEEVQPSNTNGGTFTAGSYVTRVLNTLTDPTGIVKSLASNQFVLSPGTYFFEIKAPATFVNQHKVKLRNITAGTDAIVGQIASASRGAAETTSSALCEGQVTITSATTFEIQHRSVATQAGSGLGLGANFGEVEKFTTVKITKVR